MTIISLQGRLLAGSQDSVQRQTTDTCVNLNVVPFVHTAPRLSQKKEVSPGSAVRKNYKIRSVKGTSCVTQLSFVKPVTNVKNAASNPPVGARLQNFWRTWLNLGAKGGLHSPLPEPAKLDKVSHCHKLLCKPSHEQLPVGGFTSAYRQK